MLSRLKSTVNNLKEKYEGSKAQAVWKHKKELCQRVTGVFSKIINSLAKKLIKIGVSANFVTITGFIIGIFAVNFLSLERYGYALLCILINRLFDALDGAIARHTKVTDFGVFLDATLDYIFYALQNIFPASVLSFLMLHLLVHKYKDMANTRQKP